MAGEIKTGSELKALYEETKITDEERNAEPLLTPSAIRSRILDRIRSFVCKDRQSSYGDAEDNFAHIAKRWTLYLQCRGLLHESNSIDPRDVGVMMADLKISRIAASLDHQDNYDDLGGYAVCAGGINERMKQS